MCSHVQEVAGSSVFVHACVRMTSELAITLHETALHSQPSADPAFVRRAPSAERGDGYSATAAGRKNEALADRMMLGKLPSRPMTCRRDTASVLPTTSSMFFGRYFSTCESTETEASYMSKILDTMGRFRVARHLINVLRQVLVRLQEPCQSR